MERNLFMKKHLQTTFQTRQYMLSKDFEIYYYDDYNLSKVDLHTHDYYEFYFFLEGDISIEIARQVYSLKFGDVLVVPPYIPHRPIIHNMKVPYRRFVLWISQNYYDYLLSNSCDYGYLPTYVLENQCFIFHNEKIQFYTIQSKIIQLIEEEHSSHFGRSTQLNLCISDLILFLNRILYKRNHPISKIEEVALYQKILSYIEEHLDENLSLDCLAKEFYMSKYHISHVFKDNLGLSIHQYITKKRLALCKQAIQGQMSITEAYQSFGFGDYSSFYRAFKKEYGISPKDFRDMQMDL